MLRQLYDEPLTDQLFLIAVEVTEPGCTSQMFEVHCRRCGDFDLYENQFSAEQHGTHHQCQPERSP